MLGNSAVVFVVVVRTRPRAIPLAMKTMRKSIHGFPVLSHMSMELRYYILIVTMYTFVNKKLMNCSLHPISLFTQKRQVF